MEPQFRGNWYPGLDGVRAIAVLLVFLTHALPIETLAVGWVGVQVFFVLSGFLITGILYDNRNAHHRWRNFYARRTLRIFPLFYFVWLLIAIATPFVHLEWRPIQALWPLYIGNYLRFFAGTPLTDQFYIPHLHEPLMVGHFWSLAVEEQFYVIWPLIVFAVSDRERIIRLCKIGIVAVLALRIVLFFVLPAPLLDLDILYRMTITQADGFMIGALLAMWMRGPERERLAGWATPLMVGAFGLFMAVEAFFLRRQHYLVVTNGGWTSTAGYTLLDLGAAGMIIAALHPGTLIYRVCTTRFFRRLGLYSYGFYVYHRVIMTSVLVPVHQWVDRQGHHLKTPLQVVYVGFLFLVVFGVSALSYHFVEMPFLRLKGLFGEKHRNPQLATAHESAAVGS